MPRSWVFSVIGTPVPKGSAKAFMRKGMRFPVVIQDNAAKQKPWASAIAYAAQEANIEPITVGPVYLRLRFFMPRVKSDYNSAGLVRERCVSAAPTKKPDLDKLIRCVKDALKGIVYNDDSQVVQVIASKVYVQSAPQWTTRIVPGVEIEVSEFELAHG